jgi:hypothetical protein
VSVTPLDRTILALLLRVLALSGTALLAQAQAQDQDHDQESQQEERVEKKKDRAARYGQDLAQQERVAEERGQKLQQSRRMAQYRYQEEYVQRIRQQRVLVESRQSYDRPGDPLFYEPATYRYHRGESDYETNQHGADLLRGAVDYGYEAGLRSGRADRQDRWEGGYEDSFAFRDANYGYSGEYVDQSEYNHYFREGFRRGYEDGFNSRNRYGKSSNGRYELTASQLSQIIDLQPLSAD